MDRSSDYICCPPPQGITKEYATAHFPDRSTHITLVTPGKSKKWHPRFYRRDVSRNYMVTGEWLDFVRDNHVQEGDICLLLPTRDDVMRRTFTVYVLHETSHYSAGGPGASSVAKMASEIRTEEEPAAGIVVARHKETISCLSRLLIFLTV
jgi:hypothetical protein